MMKLEELYDNHLAESLNNPLPYTKNSPSSYSIELSETENLTVYIHQKTIQKYNCVSVLFVNPKDKEVKLTNFFNGPKAIRVFSTIIDIFKSIDFDILVLIPDDIDVNVEGTKTRLYNTVLVRLMRLGRISGRESLQYPEFSKPILIGLHNDGADLSIDEIAQIVKRFGIEKLNP